MLKANRRVLAYGKKNTTRTQANGSNPKQFSPFRGFYTISPNTHHVHFEYTLFHCVHVSYYIIDGQIKLEAHALRWYRLDSTRTRLTSNQQSVS